MNKQFYLLINPKDIQVTTSPITRRGVGHISIRAFTKAAIMAYKRNPIYGVKFLKVKIRL